jgi:hypothetical protein
MVKSKFTKNIIIKILQITVFTFFGKDMATTNQLVKITIYLLANPVNLLMVYI